MRYLRAHDLPRPVRPLRGPAPHEVVWREANSARVHHILQNPAYAGAYVYGRRQADPVRRRGGARSATTKVALGEWAVCLPAAHPGYISWEAFMANQRRLADNTNRYAAGHTGVPRRGSAVLQGVAACGRCGRRMSLCYTGPTGLPGLLLPCRSRSQCRAAVPGGARLAGRHLCRAYPPRRPHLRPDRHRRRGTRAVAGGNTPAGEAMGFAARTRPLRGRAGAAPIRRSGDREPPGGTVVGAGLP